MKQYKDLMIDYFKHMGSKGIKKLGIYQWSYTVVTKANLHLANDWFIK